MSDELLDSLIRLQCAALNQNTTSITMPVAALDAIIEHIKADAKYRDRLLNAIHSTHP